MLKLITGLPDKMWKKVWYGYLDNNRSMTSEEWENMDDTQRWMINELKKYKRSKKPKIIMKKHHSWTDQK